MTINGILSHAAPESRFDRDSGGSACLSPCYMLRILFCVTGVSVSLVLHAFNLVACYGHYYRSSQLHDSRPQSGLWRDVGRAVWGGGIIGQGPNTYTVKDM